MQTYFRNLTNHGGSFTVRIPRKIVQGAQWRLGDPLTLNLDPDGTLKLRKLVTPDLRPGQGGMGT
jgi:antitoxin component of MazEF toxin-antitoxin module